MVSRGVAAGFPAALLFAVLGVVILAWYAVAQEPPPALPATVYGSVDIVCQANGSVYPAPAGLPVRAYSPSGELLAETVTGEGTQDDNGYLLVIEEYSGTVDVYVGSVYVASVDVASGDVIRLDLVVDESTPPGVVPWISVEPVFSPRPNVSWGDAQDNLGVKHYVVELFDSSGGRLASAVVEGTQWSPPEALADGWYTVRVYAVDLSCNVGQAVEAVFAVDTLAPRVESVAPVNGSVMAQGFVVNVSVVEEVNLSVRVSVNGSEVAASVERLDSGKWLVSFSIDGGDGWYIVDMALEDPAGHSVSVKLVYAVDTSAPVVEVVEAPFGGWVNSSSGYMLFRVYDAVSGVDWGSVVVSLNGSSLVLDVDEAAGIVNASYSGLAEGWYVVYFEASDRAGNTAVLRDAFGVDLTPPEVSIVEPSDGAVLETSDVCIRARVWDGLSGVDAGSVRVLVKGLGSVEAVYNASTGYVEACVRLADGEYRVVVEARDLAGNIGSASSVFTVATGAPVVVVYSPALGGVNRGPAVVFNITVSDEGGLGNVSVYVDGRLLEGCSCGGEKEWVYSTVVELAEGEHTLRIAAYDTGGLASIVEGVFHVDASPPVVVLLQPPPTGAYVGASSYCVVANVTDTYGVALVNVSLGGRVRSVEGGGVVKACFEGLADGNYTVRVVAVDTVGFAAEAAGWVVIDTVAPRLVIERPLDNETYIDAPVRVKVSAADDLSGIYSVRVYVNGSLVLESPEGSVDETLELRDGRYVIRVEAVDLAGNRAEASRTVTVDVEPPSIHVLEPVNGSVYNRQFVRIAADIVDEGLGVDKEGIQLLVDGSPVNFSFAGGRLSALVELEPGQHTLEISASDRAGHRASASIVFLVDLVAPSIVVSPADGSFLRSEEVTVVVNVSDDAGLKSYVILVDGRVVDSCESGCGRVAVYQARMTLAEGIHRVQVEAIDIAGKYMEYTVTFYVDLTRPRAEIIEPLSGSVVGNSSVCIVYRVVDNIGLRVANVYVDGKLVESVREQGLHELCLELDEGTHRVIVRAVDRAGWSSEAVAKVGVDLSAPSIEVLEPVNGSVVGLEEGLRLKVVVYDSVSRTARLQVEVNGATVFDGSVDVGDTVLVDVPARYIKPGLNDVRLYAYDVVGHASLTSIAVYAVKGRPGLVIVEPGGDVVVTNSTVIPVRVEVNDVGVPVSEVWVEVDGRRVVMNLEGNSAWVTLNLSDGRYSVKVLARYEGLGIVSAGFLLVVDTRPPTIEAVSPVNGSVVAAVPVELRVQVSDAVSGVSSVVLVMDNGTVVELAELAEGVYGANVSLGPGVAGLRVRAADLAGNYAETVLTLYVDLAGPVVVAEEPVVVVEPGGSAVARLRVVDDCVRCIVEGVGRAGVEVEGPAELLSVGVEGVVAVRVEGVRDGAIVVRVYDTAGRVAEATVYVVVGRAVKVATEFAGLTMVGVPGRLPLAALEALLSQSCPDASIVSVVGPEDTPVAVVVNVSGVCRLELPVAASEGTFNAAVLDRGVLVVSPLEPVDPVEVVGGSTALVYELVNGTWRAAAVAGGVVVGGAALEPGRAYYIYILDRGEAEGAVSVGQIAAASRLSLLLAVLAAAPAAAADVRGRRLRRVFALAVLAAVVASAPAVAASPEARVVGVPSPAVAVVEGEAARLVFKAVFENAYQSVVMVKLSLPEGVSLAGVEALAAGKPQEARVVERNGTVVVLVPNVDPPNSEVTITVALRAAPGSYNVSWIFAAQALERLQPMPPVVEKGSTLVTVEPAGQPEEKEQAPTATEAQTETETGTPAEATPAPAPTTAPGAAQNVAEATGTAAATATPEEGAAATTGAAPPAAAEEAEPETGGGGRYLAVAALVAAAAAALLLIRRR